MAFEIVWDDVLATAKSIKDKLALFTVAEQNIIIEEAECHVPETYGKLTKTLRRYWAAHIAEQSTLESAGEGAFTGESIGSVSSSKNQPVNNPQADQGQLETTYGRTYDYYIRKFRKHNIISFGLFSNNQLTGLGKNAPE